MEGEDGSRRGHVLLLPYPSQGHINPMLQFAKRLASHGPRATLAVTRFILSSATARPETGPVAVAAISDGFDDGGFARAPSIAAYLDRLESAGSESLADLIESERAQGRPVGALVYDGFLPWALDVGKRLGLVTAAFFTQSCAVDAVYYHVREGRITAPLGTAEAVSLPGLPLLEPRDLPSFLTDRVPVPYPAYLEMLVNQYRNLEGADVLFINTFYELERQEVEWMTSVWPVITIGPTVPSSYLDNSLPTDTYNGFHLYPPDTGTCMTWLDSKPPGSVVYVSFGSMANLGAEQTAEIACGLRDTRRFFLWVVRASEAGKLPGGFAGETSEKGLVVAWCPQLEVLAHRAVGCFVTHCGWNSTLEGLSLGVPMVGVPQWTDQMTDAKYVADVWGIGVRAAADGEGVVRREEVVRCVGEVMEGGRGEEMRRNAGRWRETAKRAVSEGGSSYNNIVDFVAKYCS